MKIGLLVCDHVRGKFLAISGDYTDMFVRLFAGYPDVEIVPYDAINGELPADLYECDAWIATGSKYSVNDDYQWIRDLEDFVRRVAASSVPFVGVCFGHQLIASALGGLVVQSERGWGVGVKEVEIAKGLEWADPGVESYRVLTSHADQVEVLPTGARVIGWNEHCPVSMMGIGDTILGIQGHPEMEPALTEALIRDRLGSAIPEETALAGLESFERDPENKMLADWMLRFINQALSAAASGSPAGS